MDDINCECGSEPALIFACSGGCNVGQISNEVAKILTLKGKGKMYCLAGIGGSIKNIITMTNESRKKIVIDGCPVYCARKTLEEKGMTLEKHIVMTELGVEKNGNLEVDTNVIENIIEKIENEL
jgi:uncharacterized metal-binding protein